ncbi:hypothetical protein CIB84_005721 [Bambusicola thoracicus]|uniref:Nucleolar protein 12 n=1 Tax=Bambusicola thoracicus TaxID=9083 RepID=A0A2P4T2E7_BAMTH|nr:hypothetical protein CIB84_005721 [Bambusicola thoracicus]
MKRPEEAGTHWAGRGGLTGSGKLTGSGGWWQRGLGMGRKKKKGSGSAASRLVVTFDEERRREYLTGFHKRKVERRKVALEEIKRKLKEEQRKMKEERHQEYMKMLREREEALVTTISDLDLSGARQLGLTTSEVLPLVDCLIASTINVPGA